MSDSFNARVANLSVQQLRLLAIELRARLDRMQAERHDPIAVVGLGCRFPGADGPDAFWKLVSTGQDAIREIPADRWPADQFFDPDPDARGRMATRWGGFLDGIDRFDPEFFGIAPREAHSIDPQHRLLLEVAWEALEHAGVAPDRLRGSRTGVFVGLCSGDYFQLSVSRGYETIDTYLATGGSHSVASGRLSYVLGLEGPAVSIDTACSSSLMAVHLAARSLRQGECRMALAAGVNAILWPGSSIAMSRGRMMAADGRCKTFDARGDGFVRGEGCGVVVLKRLADAIADGDRVLALIRGTAANQDGRSNGLTAPNGRAQTAVITDALADAGIAPAEVSYVEAHGTGTPLGDPIELHALGAALSPGRDARDLVQVGSVKTNIGHLEGAAGIAGLIKTILMLQARRIAPSLHFEQPNPFIDWASIPVTVPTSLAPWEPRQGRRVAGVSSFGFSGSNAHLILEEAPAPPVPAPVGERPVHLLALSARSGAALRDLAQRYERTLALDPDIALADLCCTASAGRAHFDHRVAFVARSTNELRAELGAFAEGRLDATMLRGELAAPDAPRVAFLFTGQGAQYVGMGAALLRREPVFRAALERCAATLDPILPSPLLATIHAADPQDRRIHDTRFTQPAMLALQFALAELWRSWGIVPAAVMGHSLGEYAAAVVAGVISIEDALGVVAERARLMRAAPGEGAMLAAFADGDVVREYLAASPSVSVAAFNGPDNTVLSGPKADVARIQAALERAGIEVRPLEISHAFHSVMTDPVLDDFERAVARASLRPPQLTLISNLTGAVADEAIATPTYWRRHLREPVRFADGMARLVGLGTRLFVEIGPHPSLIAMARRYTTGEGLQWLASMRRDRDDVEQITETLGALYVQGAPVDWSAYAAPRRARKIALPTYPFQRESYWIDVDTSRAGVAVAPAGLPGRRIDVARGPAVFDGAVALADLPWLGSHRIGGTIVAPAPLLVDIARAAGAAAFGFTNADVMDLRIAAPLAVPETGARRVQTFVERQADGDAVVEILSQEADGQWTSNARCRLREATAQIWPVPDPAASARCRTSVDVGAHYARLEAIGVAFGPDLRRLLTLARGDGEAVATVSVIPAGGSPGAIHPAVIDGCLHALGVCLPDDVADAYLMVGADRIALTGEAVRGDLHVHARLRSEAAAAEHERVADVWIAARDGAAVALVEGVRLRRTRRPALASPDVDRPERWIYEPRWEPAPIGGSATHVNGQRWLLVGGTHALRAAMQDAVVAAGGRATGIDLDSTTDDGSLEACLAQALDLVTADAVPTHVVHLEGATPVVGDLASAALTTRVERVCRSALALSRQVISREWTPRVWFVTTGATPATGARDVAGGALWGFARTLANEHPELWGGLVDLDEAPDAEQARRLTGAIAREAGEPAIAMAAGTCAVARLARVERGKAGGPAWHVPSLRADATYVVTGALGGIGIKVVGWLVERGARHLALLVRRAPDAAQERTLDGLRIGGADIRLVRADVAVEADVVGALASVRASMPRIAGVLHVAGRYHDAVIERMDWPRFASVLASKVDAAWHLHRHTLRDALDHFVLFSSGASLLGPVGLANYAAANAGLDVLAHLRRAEGRPAVSVDWGPWANTGMAEAVGSGRQGQWTQAGFGVMPPASALQVLGDLMAPNAPAQAAVLPVDWPVFRASQTGRGPLFANLAAASAATTDRPRAPFDVAALGGLAEDERLERLVAFLCHEVARELGVPHDRVPLGKPLNALGLDSLMAVHLRNRVQEALQVTIPVSRFIEGPSVRQLGADLLDRIGRLAPVSAPTPVEVEGLSDAEVERMLLDMLSEQRGTA
jgi:phthiocerol/phenolphthiocerol synthesis type-I polyketide synthase D